MGKIKAIYETWEADYVTYNNPDDAQITYESYVRVKKLLGIPIAKKRFRKDCDITNKRAIKKTGFK